MLSDTKAESKNLWRASTCSNTKFRWTWFWSCSTNKQVRPKCQLSDIGDPVVGVHVRFTIGSKMQCSLVGQDSCRWLDRWRYLIGNIFLMWMSTLFGSDCHYEWCQSNETSAIQATGIIDTLARFEHKLQVKTEPTNYFLSESITTTRSFCN